MYALPTQTIGAMATHVERPWLDREATVLGVDHRWKPNTRLSVNSNVTLSHVDQNGVERDGHAVTSFATYNPDKYWGYQLLGMAFSREFDPNDMGYLGRNDLIYTHAQVRRTWPDQPKESRYSSKQLTFRLIAANNQGGLRLDRATRLQFSADARDGGSIYGQWDHNLWSYDDRMTRGRNPLKMPGRDNVYFEQFFGRRGKWQWNWAAQVAGDGLKGNRSPYWYLNGGVKYFINDGMNIAANVETDGSDDSLIWDSGNTVGRYHYRTARLNSTFNWDISPKSDLRVKVQALGLDAKGVEFVDVLPDASHVHSVRPPESFRLNQMGLQIRYRYELAPLSNLYVVYGRGGFSQFDDHDGQWSMLQDSFRLRNDEQFMVKVSYRFAN